MAPFDSGNHGYGTTVFHGPEIRLPHQFRLVVYSHYLRGFLYIPTGCLEVLNHQELVVYLIIDQSFLHPRWWTQDFWTINRKNLGKFQAGCLTWGDLVSNTSCLCQRGSRTREPWRQMSNEKIKNVCLGYIVGDEKLPSYMGIIINHDRDPIKQPASWKVSGFFFVAQMCFFTVCSGGWSGSKGAPEPGGIRPSSVLVAW